MDKVFIEGFEVDALIGVHEWERRSKRVLVFDIDFDVDVRPCANADDLTSSVDYAAVCALVAARVEGTRYRTLEALAEEVAKHLLDHFPAASVGLTIRKPQAVLKARAVGISIRRFRAAPGEPCTVDSRTQTAQSSD